MRYSLLAAPIALAASVSAGEYNTTSIEVVSTLTTYCPSATSLSINGKLHTVTEATTLTITECPCTITHSLVASSTTSTPIAPAVILSTAPAAPLSNAALPIVAPYPVSNSTAPIPTLGTASAAGTGSPSSAPSASSLGPASPGTKTPFKGAGDRVAASSVSLVALIGLAAYLL